VAYTQASVSHTLKEPTPQPNQPSQTGEKKTISGFSLSSIKLKKEAKQQKAVQNETAEQPQTPFSAEDLLIHWNTLKEEKLKAGAHNLASLLAMEKPKLQDNFVVAYQVANSLNEVEMKHALPEILAYLREKLNNYSLTIELSISEQIREETVYRPDEKYNYLLKINPELKNLKDTFDLDL